LRATRRWFGTGLGMGLLAGVLSTQADAVPLGAIGELELEFARLDARSGGRLGVAVVDTGTGQRAGHRVGERFPMCSTFKALACAAVLARVDAGQEDLERRVRYSAADLLSYAPVTKDHAGDVGMTMGELCAAAVTLSDNTAANLILASLGGPSAVTAFARSLGDPITRLDRIEGGLNEATPGDARDTTTPDAMASNLRSLVTGDALSKRSRDQFVTWLVGCQTGDAKLRAGVPATWRVGDKTGSGGHGTTNDVAVMWPPGRAPVIVSVYITDTVASSDEANAMFVAVGRAVRAALAA